MNQAEDFDMTGLALITGGSSGIGLALAKEFARAGNDLILVSELESELHSAKAEIVAEFPNIGVSVITSDLSQPGEPRSVFDEVSMNYPPISFLVNDAGVGRSGEFVEIPLDKDLTMIRLNIEALTVLTKMFLPQLLKHGGRILNVGSVAGFQPGPLLAVYHASKAYVVSLSEALAEELKDTKVTVTCLCPGPTDTEFFDRAAMQDSRVVENSDLTMMDPADVAKGGYEAMMRGERIYIPGVSNKVMTFMRRVIPLSLQAKINKKLYESGEESDASRV